MSSSTVVKRSNQNTDQATTDSASSAQDWILDFKNEQVNQVSNTVTPTRLPRIRFPDAPQPDVVRAVQKDAYLLAYLQQQVKEVFSQWFGTRQLIKYGQEVATGSDLAYYTLTTLAGTQTVGEEYVDILPVNSRNVVPGFLQRGWFVLIQVIVPYLIQQRGTQGVLNLVKRFLAPEFRALHLALFYLLGRYYRFSNRLAGIRYIFTRRLQPGQQSTSYEFLGVLIMIQLAITLFMQLRNGGVQEKQEQDFDDDDEILSDSHIATSSKKCTLCLGPRKHPAITICGHVFCWKCIVEWSSTKPECPLCRQAISPSTIIPLYNYS